jgi:hypothetical protein
VKEFAQRINTNRNNVYDIFKRETIDTGLLLKISHVLEHNFFHYYLPLNEKLSVVGESSIKNFPDQDTLLMQNKIKQLEKEIKILHERLEDKEIIIELLRKKTRK